MYAEGMGQRAVLYVVARKCILSAKRINAQSNALVQLYDADIML